MPKGMRVLGWPAFRNRQLNPYNSMLYSQVAGQGMPVEEFSVRRALLSRHSVWHLHWPECQLKKKSLAAALLQFLFFALLLESARARGSRIFWTAHNHAAHENLYPRVEKLFWRYFLSRLHGIIHLTEAGRRHFHERHAVPEGVASFVIPHGNYVGAYPDETDRAQARRSLGLPLDAEVALFIGQIRPYKNVPRLIGEFRKVAGANRYLVVAGKPLDDALRQEIVRAAEGCDRVMLSLGFIPDEEIQSYLRGADLVVLPFQELQNSGSALLALSFGRPLLVPKLGGLAELQEMAGHQWVRTYEGEIGAAEIGEACAWAAAEERPAMPDLEPTGWHTIAAATIRAYRSVCRK